MMQCSTHKIFLQSPRTINCPGCPERDDEIMYHMGTLVTELYVLTAGEVFHLHKVSCDWSAVLRARL